MLRSLRTQLWLSHSLLILLVLVLMSAGLLVYLVRNPAVDRQAMVRLDLAAGFLERVLERRGLERLRAEGALPRLVENENYRVIIRSRLGQTVFESDPQAEDPEWDRLGTPIPGRGNVIDSTGQVWLYSTRPLDGGNHLFVLIPRVGGLRMIFSPQFREVFREEVFTPFLRIGLGAGLLAFLTAFVMSRSITRPLQDMAAAAEDLAVGEPRKIVPSGPKEIQSLGRSFNEMVAKVHASRQAQRDFVANVSHELKTPLTSIRGFAGAIQDGTADSDQARKRAAGIIKEEAERMDRLVRELLDLARLDAGTAGLERKPIRLEKVLRDVVRQMTPQAQAAGISLDLHTDSLPTCLGDQDRLAQVFTNLVDNAVDYSPEGAAVTIRAWHEAGDLLVSVADQGKGIPREDQDRVFERFYQVDKSRDRSTGAGTGLGLAIAQELVEAHQGSIELSSIPGQGATFTVTLPAVLGEDDTVASRKEGGYGG